MLGSLIAWTIAGTGMLMLAFVFQNLAIRKPDLDSGVFIYAKAGFGDYAGFNSAIGFWASTVAGNTFYWVFISATVGAFFDSFGDGDTLLAVALARSGSGLFHVLIARGVRDAAVINRIVTVFKIIPILVFIVVLFVNFDAGVFADNWTAYGYGDLGDLNEQVRNTMLITTFVFIGIEGASVYSRYAKKREDVGRATVMGFLSVLSIFALVTLSSYSVVPQPELAATRQPSMVGVFESGRRRLGRGVHQRRGDRLGAGRLPRLDADGGRGDVHPGPAGRLPASSSGRRTPAAPRSPPSWSPRSRVQGLLALTLFVDDALNFMLDLSTSLALLPYLLAAAYALKLGLTGETYEGVTAGRPAQGDDRRGRRHGVHDLPLRRRRDEVRAADDGDPRAGVAALRQGPQRARPAAVQPGRDRAVRADRRRRRHRRRRALDRPHHPVIHSPTKGST